MKRFLCKLQTVIKHPATQTMAGMILLVSGGYQIVLDFANAERGFRLGVHHGVAIYGLIQMLGNLPALIEGVDRSFTAVERD